MRYFSDILPFAAQPFLVDSYLKSCKLFVKQNDDFVSIKYLGYAFMSNSKVFPYIMFVFRVDGQLLVENFSNIVASRLYTFNLFVKY